MIEEQEYLDPRLYYANELDNWTKLWCHDTSFYHNFENIIDECVYFPNREAVLPLVTIYSLVPSKWSKVLGILMCYGREGSGKSTVSHLACKFHGQKQTFSATDTFASIRNSLDKMRWLTSDKQFEKEGAILCWDNIHSSTLTENKAIYQMLLFGYNRASEKISIANSSGENLDFYVFSPKILSTVDPIHLDTRFRELHRRIYLIPHKPYKMFTAHDKEPYQHRTIEDRLDLDSICWDGIEDKFHQFWGDKGNCAKYAKLRTSLTRKNSQYSKNLPKSITSERWTITIDLIVTGIVTGKWSSPIEAIEYFDTYWQYIDSEMIESSATIGLLKLFINEQVGREIAINQKLIAEGFSPNDIYLSPNKLKDKMLFHAARGELDISATNKEISEIMNQLGWKLTTKGWKQI
ncbi:MAG: hypothetical protein HC815_15150 [Richelia sp. RM1_1_1]|nr:hypothetical protein [Richelia sp. RM1_1_1]